MKKSKKFILDSSDGDNSDFSMADSGEAHDDIADIESIQSSSNRGSSVSRSIPTPSPPSFEDREAEWKKMVKPCTVKLVKLNNLGNKKSTATNDFQEVAAKIIDATLSLSKPEQTPLRHKLSNTKGDQKIMESKKEILDE